MKFQFRLCLLFLAILSLSFLLVACGGDSVSSGGTDTEIVAPPPPPKGISISDLSGYSIIRSKSADLTLKSATSELKRNMGDLLGYELNIYGDGEEPAPLEILVGETDRPESVAFMTNLRYHDYGYAVTGDKIVIGGHSKEDLETAIAQFYTALTEASAQETPLLPEGEYVTRGTYPAEDMTLCGLPTKGLTVVYGTADKEYATLLAETVSDRSGYLVNAVSARSQLPEQGNLLILGVSGCRGLNIPDALSEADFHVETADNAVLLAGGEYGYERLCYSLLADVMASDGKAVPLPSAEAESALLRTVSYNVLVSGRTEERTAALVESIRWMNPDTIGLQEANAQWMQDFATYLPEYAAVGVGRSNGSTEGTYILYRKDKFTLLDSGTRWLSNTPETESKVAESKYHRTYTYVQLQRNSDGKIFVHANTHLDHTSDLARTKQGAVLLKELERFKEYPIIITGDFNCTSSTDVYTNILSAGYRNSASSAPMATQEATFRSSGKTIDFCFVSPENLTLLHYRVFSQKVNDLYPSDHNAVYTDFVLN